ncbi:hypothetical protein O6H91_13G051700 [Diphasiastrum complanatum]|uniref:Uncharacterized protein n=1 Tax=Diphasiastrum complanatum TaxID=34168 RepID=A0ACC2BUN2_DIPCM|nr:hypothetical protein O6H91_13G051700 [Diphasiastrum complanatum]
MTTIQRADDCEKRFEDGALSQSLLSKHELDMQLTSDGSTNLWGLPAIRRETGGTRSLVYLMGFFVFGTAALYGFAVNLVLYATRSLHLSNVTAVTIGNNFFGMTYLLSFVGGFLADAYWGRYFASAVFLTIYAIGLILLTSSAFFPGLRPAPCVYGDATCQPPSTWQLVVFFFTLLMVAIGFGGSEPCVYAFGADQYDEGDDVESKQKSSFFNWQYLCYSIGSIMASLLLVYVENTFGYAVGFGACTLTLVVGLAFFFGGTPIYRFQKLQGNPVSGVAQVLVAAVRKWKVTVPVDTTAPYKDYEESCNQTRITNTSIKFRFLDKASVETDDDVGSRDPWRVCEVTQVEEVKRFFNLLPLFLSTTIYSIVHIQILTIFVAQGATMDNHLGKFQVPTASLFTFNMLSGMAFTLIYELVLMPIMRKRSSTGQGLGSLPRICIGLALSALAMLVAAAVERRRLIIIQQLNLYDVTPVPMSVFWQVPQFAIVGLSEVFAWVGMTEFCYAEAPEGLRTAGSALFLVAVAVGSFASSVIIYFISKITSTGTSDDGWIANNLNRGHLDYFFLLLAGISVLNIIYTMIFVRSGKVAEEKFSNSD